MSSQWLAWRFGIPAIILLLSAGLLAGPGTGLLLPKQQLGALLQPMVAVAVAIILFEGGLTLDARGLRDAAQAVRRMVVVVAPLMWVSIAAAAHYIGLLSWPSACVLAGIMVVTGPTVVQPLLRNARMNPRPAAVLRWEAIVNDPIGALFAVLAYEVFVQTQSAASLSEVTAKLILCVVAAAAIGAALGKAISYCYRTTWVPEYLKVPLLFVLVVACLVSGNLLLDEAGLLSVTAMGVVLGNSRIASLAEIRRFKEHAAVLLVSGVFVLLTADIDPATISNLTWRYGLFAVVLILVLRPACVCIGTLGTNLTWRERLLISWVAPRGVVAVATSAVFGQLLAQHGVTDGTAIAPLVFAIVLATVILFGLTTGPLARRLKLASTSSSGVLIVGCNEWTVALARACQSIELPVMLADRSWYQLKRAREAGLPSYYGEILSEAAEHRLDRAQFGQMIAATDSHAYNTLVCTDLGPTFGRQHVFQVGRLESEEQDPQDIATALGGRTLMKAGYDLESLLARLRAGWVFRKTKLTEAFDFEAYQATLPAEAQFILSLNPGGTVYFATINSGPNPAAGDMVLSFGPP